MADQQTAQKPGRIVEIKGVVIDAVFPESLPEIYNALRIEIPEAEGAEARTLIAEVQQHLGDDRVRAVAMDNTDGEIDRAVVVYNAYVSPLTQKVTAQDVLPISEELLQQLEGGDEEEDRTLRGDFIYEPEPEEILARLLPVYLETVLYRALLESAASELGARMTAMRNASKNAGELIDTLTLAMNRARQAEITQEILEVVGGAEALTA